MGRWTLTRCRGSARRNQPARALLRTALVSADGVFRHPGRLAVSAEVQQIALQVRVGMAQVDRDPIQRVREDPGLLIATRRAMHV